MHTVRAGEVELAVADEGDGEPVILLHGFPELAWSWRHVMPALAEAGYRAIAPDQRGYGGSSKPKAVEAYGLGHLAGDVTALADALDLDTFHLVGHDWGSIVAWTMAVTAPDRLRSVTSLNVPYRGWCTGFPKLSALDERLRERYSYVFRFQEPGAEEARFAADPDRWLRTTFQALAADTGFLTDDEFAVFLDTFTEHGITGPLNWYRNIDANHDAFAHLADAPVEVPTLMVTADFDPVLPADLAEGMGRWIPDLTTIAVTNSGHWTQQEQPKQVTDALIDFLGAVTGH
jgi:pimeloyl-ACP methyl ester carboxylesterase